MIARHWRGWTELTMGSPFWMPKQAEFHELLLGRCEPGSNAFDLLWLDGAADMIGWPWLKR